MIKETDNYDFFKKHPNNVPLREDNVIRVMKSIQQKNLLKYRPVQLDSANRVVDGQHRIEAAKRLGISVFYEVQNSLVAEDMAILNSAGRTWKNDEWLHYYASRGNENYIRLQNFMKKTGLKLNNALVALGQQKSSGTVGTKERKTPFKQGTFRFPSLDQEASALEMVRKLELFLEFIKERIPYPKGWVSGPHFTRALYLFLSIDSLDFDLFLRNCGYKCQIISPKSRIHEYLKMMEDIYNWKNRDPISVDDLV